MRKTDIALASVLFLTACGLNGAPQGAAQSAVTSSPIHTVFLIVMENNNWSTIKGNASAPYINNTLLPMASHAEQYFNPPGNHPSEPNYIWLEAGDNLGVTSDSDPSRNHQSTTDHLVTYLERAGISWKSYQENIDGKSCPVKSSGLYGAKHNPMVFFDDVTDSNSSSSPRCIAHVRPYSELATDLQNGTVAQYNFITPNLCDDMHGASGCPRDLVATGDTWLSNEIPKITASSAYKNGGAIFITWDESEGGDFPIGMIVLSPLAKGGGYSNQINYTHSSMLRTAQEIFGVTPLLGDAANATDLGDLFSVPLVDSPRGCTPSCGSSVCGSDGCGGSCGTCASGQTCSSGQCGSTCVPSCGSSVCGSDGCGGSCGTCASGQTCSSGQCGSTCVPSCGSSACGDDGCGGSCGSCTSGQTCQGGQCADGGEDGTPTRQQCTSNFGNALTKSYGRLDGYLISIVPPASTSGCNDDGHHVHLQVLMGGSVYDVAINVDDSRSSSDVYTDTIDIPLPDGAWSEGWHPGIQLDYAKTLGLHSTDFAPASPSTLSADLETELAQVNHISIFGTGYGGAGSHDIHRHLTAHDGAIASDPLSTKAHLRVFKFVNDSF